MILAELHFSEPVICYPDRGIENPKREALTTKQARITKAQNSEQNRLITILVKFNRERLCLDNSKFEILICFVFVLRTPHPGGGSPVSLFGFQIFGQAHSVEHTVAGVMPSQ